jgi:hypothetical protein
MFLDERFHGRESIMFELAAQTASPTMDDDMLVNLDIAAVGLAFD